ncbi:site-specific DNA-methyltransferase [Patescibacteria group bacterium]|nr:site-specific DNA-methyltransferase [Patescibacteria group bacterium]MBU1757901.1 site-specific DNA-methyltransferase [Patescibacteria group bacterium]
MYDPFVGSGTTGFLANHFNYNFIGSDIKIAYMQENKERRLKNPLAYPDKDFDVFEHDITQPLKLEKKDALVITE